MVIKKGEKEYKITERGESWEVSRQAGALTVDYSVSKSICADETALLKYIKNEKIF